MIILDRILKINVNILSVLLLLKCKNQDSFFSYWKVTWMEINKTEKNVITSKLKWQIKSSSELKFHGIKSQQRLVVCPPKYTYTQCYFGTILTHSDFYSVLQCAVKSNKTKQNKTKIERMKKKIIKIVHNMKDVKEICDRYSRLLVARLLFTSIEAESWKFIR